MRYKEGDTWNHSSRGPTGWHCCPGCGGGVVLIGIWFRAILPPHGGILQGMMVCVGVGGVIVSASSAR